jgi:hypothetical protein
MSFRHGIDIDIDIQDNRKPTQAMQGRQAVGDDANCLVAKC